MPRRSKLLIALAVVLALLVAGDLVAKGLAERQLRDRARDAVPGATGGEAEIRSFPFVGRLLVDGSVPYVRVRVNHVGAGRVAFTFVQVELEGVHLDRDKLFRDRKVRITSLDRGTATAEISDSELSRLLGAQISSRGGKLTVTRGRVTAPGRAAARAGVLTLTAGGIPLLRLTVPRAPFLACPPDKATVVDGGIRVSCTIERIPPELVS
jgi:DUF2993 family protein